MELVEEFVGAWRVVSMERQARDDDRLLRARLDFFEDETAEFELGGLEGFMRCRFVEAADGAAVATFQWTGREGSQPVRGRGSAVIDDDADELRGWVKINRRAAWSFVAHRQETPTTSPRA
jgi:hypothetical protein